MSKAVLSPKYEEVMAEYNDARESLKAEIAALKDREAKAVAGVVKCGEAGISQKAATDIVVRIREKIEQKTKEYNTVEMPDSTLSGYASDIHNGPIANKMNQLASKIAEKYREIIKLQEEVKALHKTKVDWNPHYPEWFSSTHKAPQHFLETLAYEKRSGRLREYDEKVAEARLVEYIRNTAEAKASKEEAYATIYGEMK